MQNNKQVHDRRKLKTRIHEHANEINKRTNFQSPLEI